MIVEGDNLAAVEVLCADPVVVHVLMGVTGDNIDRDDPISPAAIATILQQRTLNQTNQCASVRRDGKTFHAFIRHAANGVARVDRGERQDAVRGGAAPATATRRGDPEVTGYTQTPSDDRDVSTHYRTRSALMLTADSVAYCLFV